MPGTAVLEDSGLALLTEAAMVPGEETRLGALEPGKLADLVAYPRGAVETPLASHDPDGPLTAPSRVS